MNNQLQNLQFDGTPISVIDHNGEGWIAGEDIGLALEYADDPRNSIRKIFERNREELEEYSVTVKLTATDGKQYDTRVYNEEGVMLIGFLSKQPKAVAFRKWAVKVLKDYRHKQSPTNSTVTEIANLDLIEEINGLHDELALLKDELLALYRGKNPPQTETVYKVPVEAIELMARYNIPRDEIIKASGRNSNCVRQHIFNARRAGRLA